MKSLKKLEWKLNWWRRAKRKTAIAALMLAGVSGIGGGIVVGFTAGAPYFNKAMQEKTLQRLAQEPVPESFIADAKRKSLDLVVENLYDFKIEDGISSYNDTGAYKKSEDAIRKVSERTGVPKYILAGMADYCEQCGSGPTACHDWLRTPITPEEAGVKGVVLWKDPEQDFLSAAGKFKKILREVKDEQVALALMFTEKENVKKAKEESASAYARLNEYAEWQKIRSKKNPNELIRYSALVAERNAIPMQDWKKRDALEKEIEVLFNKITTEKPDKSQWESGGKTWHPDLFKVTLQPGYWKYKSWWVNNLAMGGGAVKTALRLKRDGYR